MEQYCQKCDSARITSVGRRCTRLSTTQSQAVMGSSAVQSTQTNANPVTSTRTQSSGPNHIIKVTSLAQAQENRPFKD